MLIPRATPSRNGAGCCRFGARRVALGTALLLAAMIVTRADAAADCVAPDRAAEGHRAYFPCSSCHGAGGEGSEPFRAPPLAGLSSDYVRRQIENFRQGLRGAHVADASGQEMALLAKSLSDAESIVAVACHIAALPPVPPPALTLRARASSGARLYRACSTCHGEHAEGSAALGAPPLRQLPDWYLLAQLEAFRLGWRGADPADAAGQSMRAAVTSLAGTRASADLAAYIVTLRGRRGVSTTQRPFAYPKDGIP